MIPHLRRLFRQRPPLPHALHQWIADLRSLDIAFARHDEWTADGWRTVLAAARCQYASFLPDWMQLAGVEIRRDRLTAIAIVDEIHEGAIVAHFHGDGGLVLRFPRPRSEETVTVHLAHPLIAGEEVTVLREGYIEVVPTYPLVRLKRENTVHEIDLRPWVRVLRHAKRDVESMIQEAR